MNGEKVYKKLRIFIASPGDVAAERARVHSVADELNRTGNLADEYGLTLEVLDWQTYVAPLRGRPEDVVLQQLPVDTWDIFIGVMWLRFGSPTSAIDPQTSQPFDSGTEEEFALTYNKWKQEGRPKILFYRCTRGVANPDDIDPEQFGRVKNFLKQFEAIETTPGIYQTFQSTEDFERRVRQDLMKLILQYGKENLHKTPQSLVEPKSTNTRVFVSYAWENQFVAKQLQRDLNRDGVEVFVDYEKITGGDSLPARISAALDWCNTLVLLWSSGAAQSYYVSQEWESAFHLQKRIVPCVLDDTSLPALLRGRLCLNFLSYNLGYTELRRAIGASPIIITSSKPERLFNPIEDNAEYILIPGGKYKSSETGQIVQVPDLYFAKYPVTNKLYNIFLESLSEKERDKRRSYFANDKRFNGDDQPVMSIGGYSATAYCTWLNKQQKTNRKTQDERVCFRLPTDEEWEWAASGGNREYPWGNDEPDESRANYGNKLGHTTAVGSYPAGATPEGLMDMAGNVWEWMEGIYEKEFESGTLRGGSWYCDACFLRCANSVAQDSIGDSSYNGGFRVVCAHL